MAETYRLEIVMWLILMALRKFLIFSVEIRAAFAFCSLCFGPISGVGIGRQKKKAGSLWLPAREG